MIDSDKANPKLSDWSMPEDDSEGKACSATESNEIRAVVYMVSTIPAKHEENQDKKRRRRYISKNSFRCNFIFLPILRMGAYLRCCDCWSSIPTLMKGIIFGLILGIIALCVILPIWLVTLNKGSGKRDRILQEVIFRSHKKTRLNFCMFKRSGMTTKHFSIIEG